MTVKSIIEIDVQDGAFKRFQSLYSKYEQSLKKTPEAWAAVGKKIDSTRKGFDAIVAGMVASNVQARLHVEAQAKADRLTRTTADKWKDIATSTKSAASNVNSITASLIKWSALTTAFTGLVGVGSLFGLDRLGASVSRGRQSALGLGLSYGQQQSFDINASRFVDPSSFLSTIAQARGDVSKRTSLYGVGLTDAQISGGNTSDTAVAVLRGLKRIADTTDPRLFQQRIQAGNLGDITSVEGLNKLRGTSSAEFNQQIQRIQTDAKSLDVAKKTLEAWQDFTTQMSRAGAQIESIFVSGLGKLTKPLTELSEATVEVVKAFLHTDLIKDGLETLQKWLTNFASTVATPEFEQGIRDFSKDIGVLAHQVGAAVEWLANWFPKDSEHPISNTVTGAIGGFAVGGPVGAIVGGAVGYGTGDRVRNFLSSPFDPFNLRSSERHNPGNLRLPGASSGFASYGSDADGIRAIARQLMIYQKRDHLDTITGIVNKYAPPSENDTGAYIRDVAARTGFDPNAHLNLNDSGTISALISAITKHENSKSNFQPQAVSVILNNKTGADVNTSVNNLANAGQAN